LGDSGLLSGFVDLTTTEVADMMRGVKSPRETKPPYQPNMRTPA
jgi:uncharacterized protein (UPF0261 family)